MIARLCAAFVFIAGIVAPARADALVCQILGCSCDISADDMVFGDIQPLDGGQASAYADIRVHCTGLAELSPQIVAKVNGGMHGVIADRQMQSAIGGHRLHYNLYNQQGALVGEGAGVPGLTLDGGILAIGSWTVSKRLYGRAPLVATQPRGAYSDTITVRIEW